VKDANGRTKDILEPLIGSNSPWEIKKLERAHAATAAILRKFIDCARAGATIREAGREAELAGTRLGGESIIFQGSVYTIPFTYSPWAHAPEGAPFEKGALYEMEVGRCEVDGYAAQSARSFVVGPPNKAQVQLFDTVKRSFEAMTRRIEPGLTGEQMWDIALEPIKKAGLDAWGRPGHFMGFEFQGPQRLNFLPGNQWVIQENQAVTVHPAVRDRATGYVGMAGDTILVEKGGWRFLSPTPPIHDLTD
jgi:Xaa-Pro aminopeptidase